MLEEGKQFTLKNKLRRMRGAKRTAKKIYRVLAHAEANNYQDGE